MAVTTVAQLAAELNRSATALLEQLQSAGVSKASTDDALTESAYKPSAQGTKTVEPDHAVPPHEPAEQTGRLATWPPILPRLPDFSR